MLARRILAIVAFLAALGIGASWYAWDALTTIRPFYQQALAIEPAVLERESEALESRATALYNDLKGRGRWQAEFSGDQINGWLATKLESEFGDELPPDIHTLRVSIRGGVVQVGMQRSGRFATVLSADLGVSLVGPNELSIQLLSAQAGTLPVPTQEIVEQVSRAARQWNLPLRWQSRHEDLIAIVDISAMMSQAHSGARLQHLSLEENRLLVGGCTTQATEEAPAENSRSNPPSQNQAH